ncbi:Eukaryotic aspartyl protease family protein [Candida albicans]|uniref:Eukaryotic aspartyl protease family protein n=1 Tax=Candida albicans TaxID=5476 RepID=A0A8H6BU75_CANAX|nr:Eukaryotic aspartyl protease family protein [Candida albicans]
MIFNILSFISLAIFVDAVALKSNPKVISFDFELRFSDPIKRDTNFGTGTAAPVKDTHWSFPLKIGSNQDPVTLAADTGSWLIQINDANATCPNCHKHGTYNSSGSSTVVKSGKTARSFFTRSAYYIGELVSDSIQIGNLQIPQVTFNDVYNSTAGDGIFGLARPPSDKNQSIVWAAKYHGLVDKAAYSIYLQNLDGTPGALTVGGYDAAKVDGDITWTSIRNANVQAHLGHIEINEKSLMLIKTTPSIPVVVIANLPEDPKFGADRGQITCSLLEGKNFTYNLNGVDYTFPLRTLYVPTENTDHCYLALLKGNAAQLGAYVFRNLFVAVDFEDDLIGLASLKNTTATNIRPF